MKNSGVLDSVLQWGEMEGWTGEPKRKSLGDIKLKTNKVIALPHKITPAL